MYPMLGLLPLALAAQAQQPSLYKALREGLGRDPKKAYAEAATAQTRWLCERSLPAQGSAPPDASGEQACGCGARVVLTVAASGDLAYTLGGAESARERHRCARLALRRQRVEAAGRRDGGGEMTAARIAWQD